MTKLTSEIKYELTLTANSVPTPSDWPTADPCSVHTCNAIAHEKQHDWETPPSNQSHRSTFCHQTWQRWLATAVGTFRPTLRRTLVPPLVHPRCNALPTKSKNSHTERAERTPENRKTAFPCRSICPTYMFPIHRCTNRKSPAPEQCSQDITEITRM